jgi:hypothetical protein
MLFVLVLAPLWDSRKKALRIICTALICIFIAGSIVRVHRLERVWSDFTELYRRTVMFTVSFVDEDPEITTAAVKDSPLAFPYLADAVSLYRPAWEVYEVGDIEESRQYAPCIYIPFVTRGDVVESSEVRVIVR